MNKKSMRLGDMTREDLQRYCNLYHSDCSDMSINKCCFANKSVHCEWWNYNCWVNHKELYSDLFLNQEIEVPVK